MFKHVCSIISTILKQSLLWQASSFHFITRELLTAGARAEWTLHVKSASKPGDYLKQQTYSIYIQLSRFSTQWENRLCRNEANETLKTRLHLIFCSHERGRNEAKAENIQYYWGRLSSSACRFPSKPQSFTKTEHLFCTFLACHDVCHIYFSESGSRQQPNDRSWRFQAQSNNYIKSEEFSLLTNH